jgi:cell filamentation protein
MAGHSRYEVSEVGAGFAGAILANKLGITDQKTLDDAEALLLADAYEYFFEQRDNKVTRFNIDLLFRIHKFFLGDLYVWAGKVRSVDISKDGMLFAPVRYLRTALAGFARLLKHKNPKKNDKKMIVAMKPAVIHNEFNALHPFREGNGRTIRLFLDLLVSQLGYAPIRWGRTADYMKACREGMAGRTAPMAKIIFRGLTRTTRK